MTAIDLHQPGFLFKSLSNCAIVLLAQIFRMRSLTMSILNPFVLNPSFFYKIKHVL